jgi:hypothetical protein
MTKAAIKLKNKLIVQCIVDAKNANLKNYIDENYIAQLQTPDSHLQLMLSSIATVIDRESKNLEKRLNKKLHDHAIWGSSLNL